MKIMWDYASPAHSAHMSLCVLSWTERKQNVAFVEIVVRFDARRVSSCLLFRSHLIDLLLLLKKNTRTNKIQFFQLFFFFTSHKHIMCNNQLRICCFIGFICFSLFALAIVCSQVREAHCTNSFHQFTRGNHHVHSLNVLGVEFAMANRVHSPRPHSRRVAATWNGNCSYGTSAVHGLRECVNCGQCDHNESAGDKIRAASVQRSRSAQRGARRFSSIHWSRQLHRPRWICEKY